MTSPNDTPDEAQVSPQSYVTAELAELLYEALRDEAHRFMARERNKVTLQTTALVHEAYIRLQKSGQARWESERHFQAMAARVMQRILVEKARERDAEKRGGGRVRLQLGDADVPIEEQSVDVLTLNEALEELEKLDSVQADIVRLRYFGGFSLSETAESLGVSTATVYREWLYAKAWLIPRLS